MRRGEPVIGAGCAAAALLLLVLYRTGVWQRWGLGMGEWTLALGFTGLAFCAAAFIGWLRREQKTGKNDGDPVDPDKNKEKHDGL